MSAEAGSPAAAAEAAWSEHLIQRTQPQLNERGYLEFRVDTKRSIRVGVGFIEFHFSGEPERIASQDIASVSLDGGKFSIKHKDARWYSRAGKFNFEYAKMANAKVFMRTVDTMLFAGPDRAQSGNRAA